MQVSGLLTSFSMGRTPSKHAEYEKYLKAGGQLTLKEWERANCKYCQEGNLIVTYDKKEAVLFAQHLNHKHN